MQLRPIFLTTLALLGAAVLCAQPYAQNLFFSEYLEGSSNNKAIEIFNGTGAAVDLSQYTVKLGSNGGTWSTSNILTPTGTLAHNDVFVIANSQANAAILAVSDVTSTVTYFNGDDCLGLFQGDTLIDIIGVYLSDPGTAWPVAGVADATLNHTLIRKPTITVGSTDWAASAGTNANDSQWIVEAIDYIIDLGAHTFTPGGGNMVATPVFTPGGGTYTVPVTVTISCATTGASIYYTTDGSTPNTTSTPYTQPLNIAANTTLKAMAALPGMDNSYVATAVYLFPVAVANLTALRASPADGTTIYQVGGEVVLTFQQTFRNQKYLQDAGAGILIDDLAGVITTAYNIGDGITGIMGKISEYAGMLQFVPTTNTPPASSANNPIVPVVATYDQLVNSFDTYESRVVQVQGVSFTNPSGNFANGTVYASYDQDTDYNIRTTFYDVDYINTPVPTVPKDITGIPNSRTDGNFFTPRWLSDFADPSGAVAAPTFNPTAGVYFAPINVTLSTATAGADIYYTTDGSTPTDDSEYYEEPIPISATTTLKAIAVLNSEFSAVATAVYNYPVVVANLTALRQAPLQGLYRVEGEVLVSFAQSYRHQKFVQDAAAGILIDDPDGIIATAYQTGDGISNLTGTLTEYGGMLELVPVADPGPASSTGNAITPIAITLEEFSTNFETYESRLVQLWHVRFVTPTGNFATGTVYGLTDQDNEFNANFRTSFYDVDYIGNPVYTNLLNITGIPNSRTDGNYFTARDVDDFQLAEVLAPYLVGLWIDEYPDVLYLYASYLAYHFSVIPEGLTGYRLYRNNTLIQEAAPGMEAEWTDTLTSPGTYVYHATAMFGATESGPSNIFEYTFSSNPENPPAAPETALLRNSPNPFLTGTMVRFALKQAAPVRIEIFNQRGQVVRQLTQEDYPAGSHSVMWDGRDDAGRQAVSGIYLCRMRSGDYTETHKMLMLK